MKYIRTKETIGERLEPSEVLFVALSGPIRGLNMSQR